MTDEYGLIDLLASSYKDAVEEQEIGKIKKEFHLLQQAEAVARRNKTQALIRQMAGLKIELNRFEFTYQQLVRRTGITVPRIESYMKEISAEIKRLSYEKNHKQI